MPSGAVHKRKEEICATEVLLLIFHIAISFFLMSNQFSTGSCHGENTLFRSENHQYMRHLYLPSVGAGLPGAKNLEKVMGLYFF